ncbi:hypothetical protein P154DRAFT_452442 [Amniculicola lignicola CBS 123094]|uniref:Uncharacterized protein n=1 Tax=Amniculicola lignicola CBS 123094 TaxID=1392246 RepID=A0A6A5VVD8_9PLEO|nr:hypothetical protein P154DRAFT_452442 [Amniculicola lignicola CBS 123094]
MSTCPALQESWGPQSLNYYKSLYRVQSTMLLHCRSNNIGLKGNLFNTFKVSDAAAVLLES